MSVKFSPSTNIIRDGNKEIEYYATPNAQRIAAQIINDFKIGIHAFTLIGSYGTGKSSFLWAFEKSLKEERKFFPVNIKYQNVGFLKLIGEYQSIILHFAEELDVDNNFGSNQQIFDAIFQKYEDHDLLIIAIDEFGKFLEYASQNHPEKELYFLQQLAEFVNDENRNIILLTTLHQSFEAYSHELVNDTQKQEWRKVKGRYQELTFNEPVEQLLLLAAEKFNQNVGNGKFDDKLLINLIKAHNLFAIDQNTVSKVCNSLFPLEVISAITLTRALQKYGQNERSLFTFLESFEGQQTGADLIQLPEIFDYLIASFYSYLNTPYNPHYRHWAVLQNVVERIEAELNEDTDTGLALVKTIGLLQIFASKGASVNESFLLQYLINYDNDTIQNVLQKLTSKRILLFTRYNQSYKLTEGTDLDFDEAILKAGNEIDPSFNIITLLEEHFSFPVITAKAASYKTGTPRLFEFIFSDNPLTSLKPKGAIDGYINLVFNEDLNINAILQASSAVDEALLYGYFNHSRDIKDCLFEIQKTKKVLAEHKEDFVAKKELENIQKAHENLLYHHVLDAMYTDKVRWVFQGQELTNIKDKKSLNHHLSEICNQVYPNVPIFNNELVNKHKISSSIHSARKLYFNALVNNWHQEDLGFEYSKFPAEKTIYLTLLKENGFHILNGQQYELKGPGEDSSFHALWETCEAFFQKAQTTRRSIQELYDLLQKPPFKLKLGLVDFWVPTYLFIKRGDFALFENGKFIPEISDTLLYSITRNPHDYEIKAFEINGLRLKLFNKYQELLDKESVDRLKSNNFIDTIKPFLAFYKQLNDYAKKTKRLSTEAIALRNAIAEAEDPEKAFFEDFPDALSLDLQKLANSEKDLNYFANTLNDAIQEIKHAYDHLLDRIEKYIQDEIIGANVEFPAYKEALEKRFSSLKEHQLLNHQKVLLQRIFSPLDDRNSWLASIGQAVLKKSLDKIEDKDEPVLKDKLFHLIKELDNLRYLEKESKENDENIIRFDLTTFDHGLKTQTVHIPKGKEDEINQYVNSIKQNLSQSGNLKQAVLAQLLKEEFGHE